MGERTHTGALWLLVLGAMTLGLAQTNAQFDPKAKVTYPGDTVALDTLWVNDKEFTRYTLWITNTSVGDSITMWDYSGMKISDDSAGPQFYRGLRLPRGETDTVHLWIRKTSCNTPSELTTIHAWFRPNPDRVSSRVLRYPCACRTGPVATKKPPLIGSGKSVGFRSGPFEAAWERGPWKARDLKGSENKGQGRPPAGIRIGPVD